MYDCALFCPFRKFDKTKIICSFVHNPNSTKFQPEIFFTSYNEFCSRQRRAKGSRAGRALVDGGFLLWPTEWSSFGEGTHEIQVLLGFSTFFVFLFFFLLFCLIYVTVRNTNYFLCFSQFEIECVCVFFCVSVQLIEEKYCCDCFFFHLFVSL